MNYPAKRILVVDDESLLRELLVDTLRDAGFETTEAADGPTALDELKRAGADLVLLDVIMPKVDGWAVLEGIRHLAARPRVVMMSGRHEIVPPGRLAPFVSACLLKPFPVERLLQTLSTVLASSENEPASDARTEPRRSFSADVLVSAGGAPSSPGRLVQISSHGFRVESFAPLKAGDPVTIMFTVPGRADTLQLVGTVRWRRASLLGAEMRALHAPEKAVLAELMGTATPS